MIPIYRHPRKDEHIYGWIQDLAEMNRMTFRQFADVYLGGMAWNGSIDSVSGMSCLDGTEDLLSLVNNNTLFPALSPYMEKSQQAVSIDHLLNGGQKHIYHTATYMKVCPVCVNEDASQGIRPYYRVWHQLGEITVCAVHKVPLLRLKKRGPIDEETLLSAEPETEDCGDIADKIYSLYKAPVITECCKWHFRMTKRQRRISRKSRITNSDLTWIREAEKTEILAGISCYVCGKPYLTHPYTEGRYNLCRGCRQRLGPEESERVILEIRKDYRIVDGAVVHLPCGKRIGRCRPQTFLWAGKECGCRAKQDPIKIHKRAFDDGEFTVVEYLKDDKRKSRLVKIRHVACGEEFQIRPADFSLRRYCRACRQREYGYNFIHSFHAMTGDEYEVLTPEKEITSTRSRVTLRHNYCGTIYTNTARNVLIGQRCPFCVTKPGPDKVIDIFSECFTLDNGCKVESKGANVCITYPDGTSRCERAAILVQEMTRIDEPALLPGKRIMHLTSNTFFSSKAKLFVYYRKHCECGVFRASCQKARELGMTQGEYWSAILCLEKQGKIKKTVERGLYQFSEWREENGKDTDSSYVRTI